MQLQFIFLQAEMQLERKELFFSCSNENFYINTRLQNPTYFLLSHLLNACV